MVETREVKLVKRVRFEYMTFHPTDWAKLTDELNKLGQEGWEIVATFPTSTVILKRQI